MTTSNNSVINTIHGRVTPLDHQGPFASNKKEGWVDDNSGPKPGEKKDRVLIQDFGNSTTLHGLHYVSEKESHLMRK